MKKIFNLILALFFINFIFASEIELTKEEKNFLKNNPTITIGIGSGWEPSAMLSKDGKIRGYDADILKEVNKATGANFVLKIGVWKDIQQEAKDKKIQGLSSVIQTPQREENFLFSDTFRVLDNKIVSKPSTLSLLKNKSDLKYQRIAIEKGNKLQQKIVDELEIQNVIYVDKIEETYEKIFQGQTDIAIGFGSLNYKLVKEGLPLLVDTGLYYHYINLKFALNKDLPQAHSILQKGLKSITPDTFEKLKEKWHLSIEKENDELNLSQQEKAYLENKKTLVMPTYENFLPFNFIKDDIPQGYLIDLSKLVSQKLGLKLEFKNGYVWKEHMQMLKDNEIDFVANMVKTDERQKIYNFSDKTTLTLLTGIISKNNFTNMNDVKNKKIAIEKGSIFEKFIKQNYPNQEIVYYDSKNRLITALINDEIDAFIENYSVVSYLINNTNLFEKSLNINLLDDSNLNNLYMYFAFNKDELILQSIFNKVYTSLSTDEINSLKKKWGMRVSTFYPDNLNVEEINYLKNKKTLKISVEKALIPFSFVKDNKPSGYFYDINKLFADKLGLQLDVEILDYDTSIKRLENKEIDIKLYGGSSNKDIIYGETSTLYNYEAIFSLDDFDSIEDFEYKKVLLNDSEYYNELKKTYPNIQFISNTNDLVFIDKVINGELDAAVASYGLLNYLLINKIDYSNNSKLKILPTKLFPQSGKNFAMVHKDNEILLNIFNKTITDNDLSLVKNKWFSSNIENTNTIVKSDSNLNYLLLTIVVILVIALFYIDSRRRTIQLNNSKKLLEKVINNINSNNENKINLFKSSFNKYIYSLFMIAGFVAISYFVFEYFLSKYEKLGEVLNKAGKQRMLSQKLIIEASLSLNSQKSDLYVKLIDNLKTDHEWLIQNLSNENEEKFYKSFNIKEKVSEYLSLNEKMIESPSLELFNQIKEKGYLILNDFEKAVSIHENTYNETISFFEFIKLIETLFALTLMYILWIYVYKPNAIRQETLYDAIIYEKEKIFEVTKEQKNLLSLFDKGDAVLFKWKNNRSWDIEYVSGNVKNLFGYTKTDFLNNVIKYDECIYEEDLDRTSREVYKAINEKKNFFKHEPYRIVTKEGNIKWVLDVTVSQKNDENEITHFIGYLVDITEEKQLEQKLINNVKELESLNDDLQSKNEELSASEEELKAQQEELLNNQYQIEMLSKAKEQFLANMSHEIRTPLNGIVGVVDMLIDEIGNNSSAMYKLNTLKKSSNILTNVVNDILDYSSLQTGNMKLYQKEFSFRDMIKHIEDTIRSEIESKNLKFIVDIDENIEDVLMADELRLSQILLNLLSNAKKFTSQGKILLKSKLLKIDKENLTLVIEVKDTGIGMSDKILDKLFVPFTQGSESNTKEFKGTGLGLSIVKKLVDLMNGKIEVYSYEKVGTTFKVTFNLPYNNNKVIDSHVDEVIILPQKKKALFVEDDSINQFVIKATLSKRNIEVDILENGLEAVNRLKEEHSYDMVFMDVQMPVMDGHEATREIRKFNKDIPIVALSAGVLPENIEKSIDAGMNMHIVKPIISEELNKVLTTYLMK